MGPRSRLFTSNIIKVFLHTRAFSGVKGERTSLLPRAAQARARRALSNMSDPTFPEYPFRHVRPSLLFEVEKWAVVCVNTEEYHREWSLRSGDHENDECDCDYSFRNGRGTIHHVGCNFLKYVQCGSQIEVLGVCDGVDCDGLPCATPSFNTGFIWGRHFFEEGWIPTRYLLPLDLIFEENVIQDRI